MWRLPEVQGTLESIKLQFRGKFFAWRNRLHDNKKKENDTMKYQALAKQILELVGGPENVSSVTHCMTRLRFHLKNDAKADMAKIKALSGVAGCVNSGGQFQIIIGTHVEDVFNDVVAEGKLATEPVINENLDTKKVSPVAAFFDTIAGIFMPIVGALAGSGMVKAILTICTTFNWISTDSQTYTLLYMISDIVFYYLPFFIAVSAAKKLKCSAFLALIFAGMLVHPTFLDLKAAGDPVAFLGIPVKMATYTTSVIPIILIVFFQSYVEAFAKKISPKAVKVFLAPLLTILIVAPVGLIVLGPLGSIVGGYLANFFNFLNDYVSWLVPTLVAFFYPLLVMTGMHYSLGAVQATQRAAVGYATILAPGALSSNMATAGAALGVAFRTKNTDLRSLASSCGITALCGITEPALYGVNMKLKRPLYATMIGGGLAGLYAGITGIKAWSAGTSNVFSLPIYIGGENMSSFYNACITVAIAIVASFILSVLLYKEPAPSADIQSAQ